MTRLGETLAERAIARQLVLLARRGDRLARRSLGLCVECGGPDVDAQGAATMTGLCELCSAAAAKERR